MCSDRGAPLSTSMKFLTDGSAPVISKSYATPPPTGRFEHLLWRVSRGADSPFSLLEVRFYAQPTMLNRCCLLATL